MTDTEFDLRARFESLRDLEQASAPGFRRVVAAARRAPRSAARSWNLVSVGLAAAACIVVGVAVVLQWPTRGASQGVTSWQSPTTSLIPTSGQTVLAPPPLLSSVLDGATTSALWRKGD